ncbi:MAG: Mur ligase family protein, partial [Acidimicrobiales bacterium]
MRKLGIESLEGRRTGIWGTGREGRAIASIALDRGADVVVFQDASDDGSSPSEIELQTGRGPRTLRVLPPSSVAGESLDILIRSPGVSRYRPELESLRDAGVPVTTATALWFDDFAGKRVIAVTGSKGKTMTATLATLALVASGMKVGLGGNIGTPVTDFYDASEFDAYVIEVSSFQAAEVATSPGVGILTLLAPDHLDWHLTYERYVADKLNLFTHTDRLE